MNIVLRTALLTGLMLAPLAARAQQSNDYAAMLSYLNQSRIDGRTLAGADGAITVNMAAGDLNQQANLMGIANGRNAHVTASQTADRIAVPMKTALAPECDASQPPSAPPANRPAAWAVL